MASPEKSGDRSYEIARRFLQTAVVVDDKAFIAPNEENTKAGIQKPDRGTRASIQNEQEQVGRRTSYDLHAGPLIDSFSALGVVCGVVGPTDAAMETMRQADIVVLDWHLQEDGDPTFVLDLLRKLLTGQADQNKLRLVAIYTGEARLDDICRRVFSELEACGLEPKKSETETEISYQHGRVVLYAKSNVNLALPLENRKVEEGKLPQRLVKDFASMTAGLLPAIALTSLTAVREGAHIVLDQFNAELDSAFLAHKACLPNPEDAERHIANQVIEEIRGLIDNIIAKESPANANAVEDWIRCKGDNFKFGDRSLNAIQTIALANEGLKNSNKLNDKYFQHLSKGFACDDVGNLDERLAWLMSFRTVYNAPPPTLWLGSVVTMGNNGEQHLLCMRPRCDCVRLKKETRFFFLPLVDPEKKPNQIVIRIDDEFKRLGIALDSTDWVSHKFEPSGENGAVIAEQKSDDSFEFTDIKNNRYMWRGELKSEYAQRIAQVLGATLSRIAVDEPEWLRRMTRTG